MKKVLLLLLILLSSCEISKQATKEKTDTSLSSVVDEKKDVLKETTIIEETKRPGGTLQTGIIPEDERERDENGNFKELIQELRDGALTKTVIYKSDGSVDVDCTADEIWQRIQSKMSEKDNSTKTTETEFDQQTTDKTSSKTEKIKDTFIYAGAFVLLGVFFIYMKYK